MTNAKTKGKEKETIVKDYRLLDQSGGDNIHLCDYILPNNQSCWVAGYWEVTDGDNIYQLCDRHKQIQEALDAGIIEDAPPYPIQP